MKLTNHTRMAAAFTGGLDAAGRESLVVAIKGSFTLPRDTGPVRLDPIQRPLVAADTFTGEPGRSAPLDESDFAPVKARCDVLLTGSAFAPGGRPAERVAVEIAVGSWSKRLAVVGDRHWIRGAGTLSPSRPVPFVTKPIGYDVAFGGASPPGDDPAAAWAHPANPVGRGWFPTGSPVPDGAPLPCTEAIGQPVTAPDSSYPPMAFGPIGRQWSPRAAFAGTYDDRWRDEVFPFLPADFDPRYFQSAPPDQQIDPPTGPLRIRLTNLTPDGRREFELPAFHAAVTVVRRDGRREECRGTLDTIRFEPAAECFTLVWRVSRPLRRNLFEIAEVIVGQQGTAGWRKRPALPFPIPIVAEDVDA